MTHDDRNVSDARWRRLIEEIRGLVPGAEKEQSSEERLADLGADFTARVPVLSPELRERLGLDAPLDIDGFLD